MQHKKSQTVFSNSLGLFYTSLLNRYPRAVLEAGVEDAVFVGVPLLEAEIDDRIIIISPIDVESRWNSIRLQENFRGIIAKPVKSVKVDLLQAFGKDEIPQLIAVGKHLFSNVLQSLREHDAG